MENSLSERGNTSISGMPGIGAEAFLLTRNSKLDVASKPTVDGAGDYGRQSISEEFYRKSEFAFVQIHQRQLSRLRRVRSCGNKT